MAPSGSVLTGFDRVEDYPPLTQINVITILAVLEHLVLASMKEEKTLILCPVHSHTKLIARNARNANHRSKDHFARMDTYKAGTCTIKPSFAGYSSSKFAKYFKFSCHKMFLLSVFFPSPTLSVAFFEMVK